MSGVRLNARCSRIIGRYARSSPSTLSNMRQEQISTYLMQYTYTLIKLFIK